MVTRLPRVPVLLAPLVGLVVPAVPVAVPCWAMQVLVASAAMPVTVAMAARVRPVAVTAVMPVPVVKPVPAARAARRYSATMATAGLRARRVTVVSAVPVRREPTALMVPALERMALTASRVARVAQVAPVVPVRQVVRPAAPAEVPVLTRLVEMVVRAAMVHWAVTVATV